MEDNQPIVKFTNPVNVGHQVRIYRKSLGMSREKFVEHIKSICGYSITVPTLFAWEADRGNKEALLLVMFAVDMANKHTGQVLSGIVSFGNELV